VATKKPLLNKKKAADRLLDAREKDENIRRINLSKIVFLDKAAIQRRHGSQREYYRKRGNNRVGRELVSIRNKSKFILFPNILKLSAFFSLQNYNFSFFIFTILT
jgi:hypothetical protein